MTTLVFDIETIPDVALGRRLYNLEGIADAEGEVWSGGRVVSVVRGTIDWP